MQVYYDRDVRIELRLDYPITAAGERGSGGWGR